MTTVMTFGTLGHLFLLAAFVAAGEPGAPERPQAAPSTKLCFLPSHPPFPASS